MKGGKLLVPATTEAHPRISPALAALLNVCWSEAKMSTSPSTRIMFIPIDMVIKMHVLQWLAVRGSKLRKDH